MKRERGDRGQAAVQFAGFFPVALIVILLCAKIYITLTAVEQVDNAARTGAREASLNHNTSLCPTEAISALPGWLRDPEQEAGARATATVSGSNIGMISCRVQAKIPIIWSAVPFDFTVDRTVHMPG